MVWSAKDWVEYDFLVCIWLVAGCWPVRVQMVRNRMANAMHCCWWCVRLVAWY